MIYKICFRLLIGAALLLQWKHGISQDTQGRVTLDLKQASMANVLQEVERQSGYRFYYDTADLDTTKIDIRVQQEPFYKVLDEIFSGTGLGYSIDRRHEVFIAKGGVVDTGLPPGFFDVTMPDKSAPAAGDTVRDYLEEVGKPVIATIEKDRKSVV